MYYHIYRYIHICANNIWMDEIEWKWMNIEWNWKTHEYTWITLNEHTHTHASCFLKVTICNNVFFPVKYCGKLLAPCEFTKAAKMLPFNGSTFVGGWWSLPGLIRSWFLFERLYTPSIRHPHMEQLYIYTCIIIIHNLYNPLSLLLKPPPPKW